MISFSWQTRECFIEPLVSEFASWYDWSFYTEKWGNTTVPTEVALEGEQDLWVSWEYHLVHCTFVWRQMAYGYERGLIDSHVRSYPHTIHCQEMLFLDGGLAPDDIMIHAVVQYPVCERVGASIMNAEMAPEFGRVAHHSRRNKTL